MTEVMHDCPAGCGTPVPRRRFACARDWRRLPKDLRDAITSAYWAQDHGAHNIAMADAILWYASIGQDTT